MKSRIVTIILSFTLFLSYGQSNKDISKVYFKRANEATELLDYDAALSHFKQAMKYTDTITNRKTASLGAKIYFEIHHREDTLDEQLSALQLSENYSKQYFVLAKNKSSEEYLTCTEEYILIKETIETLKVKIAKEVEEERLKKLELKRIDSLKTLWLSKSKSLAINVDSIYSFNNKNVALYSKGDNYGIINDLGEIIVEANEYKDVLTFDGYFIFKNKASDPTKLYCYNSKDKSSFQLPSINDFNTLSTHYGKVMLPRGSGRLITYPNNSKEPFVYDMNFKKVVRIANQSDLLKNLKKSDIIDKYKKEGDVKINKKWYLFGGHLGGQIYPLYAEEGYNLVSFLCSVDGTTLIPATEYQFIGAFYNGKSQAIKGKDIVWINQIGTEVNDAKDEDAKYNGISVVSKRDDGTFQILREGVITLGSETLDKLPIYLRKFSK
jgi:hypothetical protein